jgi:hypothetical protein
MHLSKEGTITRKGKMNEMQTAVVVHNCNPHTWEAKGGAS